MTRKIMLLLMISVFLIVFIFYIKYNKKNIIDSKSQISDNKVSNLESTEATYFPNKTKKLRKDLFFKMFKTSKGVNGLYHIYQNMEFDSNTGFMIYFHGDNANDFNNGENSDRINLLVNISKKHNILPVALKTPSDDLTWWTDGEKNSEYTDEFVNSFLLNKFDLNKNRVLLVGYSGGSEFLTSDFIGIYCKDSYKGGAILFAGGSEPKNKITYSKDLINSFKLFFYSGTEDFMHEKVVKGVSYFKSEGFNVEYRYPKGQDHFNIPFYSITDELLNNNFLATN